MPNTPPNIVLAGGTGSFTVQEDTPTEPIAFTISDTENSSSVLSVSASVVGSSPLGGSRIVLGGTGSSRTVQVFPEADKTGSATIRLTVSDSGGLQAFTTFTVTTTAVNDPPRISVVPDQLTSEDRALGPISIVSTDIDSLASLIILSASSSDQALIPDSGIELSTSAVSSSSLPGSRPFSLMITPAPGRRGMARIILTATDGESVSTLSFNVTVLPNTAPSITGLVDRGMDWNTTLGAIPFTVIDAETPNGLVVTASSSNPSLVQNSNIALSGSGTARTLSIAPSPNSAGVTTITLTVSDGRLTSSASFNLTVVRVNIAPTVSILPSITAQIGQPIGLVQFVVGDEATPADQLEVRVESSNTSLIPATGLLLGGSGANRTLLIAPIPGQTGVSTITITVRDDGGLSTRGSFQVQVLASIERVLRVVDATGPAGGTVTVPIEMTGLGDENGLAFTLAFNAAGMKYVSSAVAAGLAGVSINVKRSLESIGRVGIALALPAGQKFPAGTRVLLNAMFSLPSLPGLATVALQFSDSPVGRETVNVLAESLPTTYRTGNISVLVNGYEADVSPRPSGSGNGTITLADWVQVGRFAARLDPSLSATEFTKADCAPRTRDGVLVTGNGVLSLADWVQAGRYATGLDPVTPAGGPSSALALAASSEARSSLRPSAVRSSGAVLAGLPPLPGEPPKRGLKILDTTLPPGSSGLVEIELVSFGDENTLGFSLSFNPSSMIFEEAVLLGGVPAGSLLNVNAAQASLGRIGIAIALSAGERIPEGLRKLVAVRFRAQAGLSGSVSLDFSDLPIAREFVDAEASELSATYQNGTVSIGGVEVSKSPSVHGLFDVTTEFAAPLSIPFILSDPDTDPAALQVSVTASHEGLLPPSSIAVTGSGANRVLSLIPTPAVSGSSRVTVSVSDGVNSVSASFTFTVETLNRPPTISRIPNVSALAGESIPVVEVSFRDAETPQDKLILRVTSSDPGFLPVEGIRFEGAGETRKIRLTPVAGRRGRASIVVTVIDERGGTASSTFDLVIAGPNVAPRIRLINPVVFIPPGQLALWNIQLEDDATPLDQVQLRLETSRTVLLSGTRAELEGGEGSRTLRVTTAPGVLGTNVLGLLAQDGDGLQSRVEVKVITLRNTPPTISQIADQTTPSGVTIENVAFTVEDLETPLDELFIKVESSFTSVIPSGAISWSGTGATRKLKIIPSGTQAGQSTITITVSDPFGGSAATRFVVTVQPINQAPEISVIGDKTIAEDSVLFVSEFNVADPDGPFEALTVTGRAAQSSLVPDGGVVVSGTGFSRSLRITPAPNAFGTTPVTLTVSDGQNETRLSFNLTVTPANDPPVIDAIPDQRVVVGEPIPTISLRYSDAETDISALKIQGASSNSAVITDSGIRVRFVGAGQQLELEPLPGADGVSMITLTVRDPEGALASTTFKLEVVAVVRKPPVVAIVAPADGAAFLAPAQVEVVAEASTVNGELKHVELFANGVSIGTLTRAPYRLVWTNLSEGKFVLSARAIDAFTNSPIIAGPTVTFAVRPDNDHFANRKQLAGSSATGSGLNKNASSETNEPKHAGRPGGRSLWWTWTTAYDTDVVVSTSGSDVDTVLAVYTGTSLSELRLVSANDDDESGGGGSSSRLTFKAVAGENYQIAVDTFGGEIGTLALHLAAAEPPGPPLVAEVSGKNVILTWPADFGDYLLESTDSMSPAMWTVVNQPAIASGSSRLLKVSVGGTQRFFRLRRP